MKSTGLVRDDICGKIYQMDRGELDAVAHFILMKEREKRNKDKNK